MQFHLPYLSLWTVGLNYFLEKYLKDVDVFSQDIYKEADIGGLALPVPSLFHFAKLALSSRALPLFYDRPSASLVGSLVLIPFLYRGMGSVPSTL